MGKITQPEWLARGRDWHRVGPPGTSVQKASSIALQSSDNAYHSWGRVGNHLRVGLQPRIVIFIAAMGIIVLAVVYGARVISTTDWGSPGATLRSAPAPKAGQIHPGATQPSQTLCPAAGVATLQASPQTGHHKVTLSWNASAPALGPDGKAVGYCLYRSTKQNAAKQKATCIDCEQINSTPVVGTGCVDDLVKDDTTYYYVVTAISESGRISSSSNETAAQTPPSQQPIGTVPVGSYPLCRATTAGSH